jgi:hypothetical protein
MRHLSCCIVGGGPASKMHFFLLALAGINIAFLEKLPDFLRDFRGDSEVDSKGRCRSPSMPSTGFPMEL